jgi:hypothetical protein
MLTTDTVSAVTEAKSEGPTRQRVRAEPRYAPVLSGFEAIDQGRRILEAGAASAASRRTANDLIWDGNVQRSTARRSSDRRSRSRARQGRFSYVRGKAVHRC